MTDDLLLRNACIEAKHQLLEEELQSLNQQADVVNQPLFFRANMVATSFLKLKT